MGPPVRLSPSLIGAEMKEPVLPHLQFAVLGVLRGGRRPGRLIREELAKIGISKAGPTFYRLMARLEEAGLVKGWYEQEVVKGQIVRERSYEALPAGLTSWDRTRAFYLVVMGRPGDELGSAHAG